MFRTRTHTGPCSFIHLLYHKSTHVMVNGWHARCCCLVGGGCHRRSWALVPTFQSSLAQGDHFIELPLYEAVSFIFIQPFPTREGLLNTSEWTVNHHLGKEIGKVSLYSVSGNPQDSGTEVSNWCRQSWGAWSWFQRQVFLDFPAGINYTGCTIPNLKYV